MARNGEEKARKGQQHAEEQVRRARQHGEEHARHAEKHRVKAEIKQNRVHMRINNREWRMDSGRIDHLVREAQRAAAEGIYGALEAVERALHNIQITPPTPPMPPKSPVPPTPPTPPAAPSDPYQRGA